MQNRAFLEKKVSILKNLYFSLKKPVHRKPQFSLLLTTAAFLQTVLKNNTLNKAHSYRNFPSRELKL